MRTLFIIIASVLLGIVIHSGIRNKKKENQEFVQNDPEWVNWIAIFDFSGFSYLFETISHAKAFDLVVFIMKYVPLSIYTYKCARSYFCKSKEKMMQKQFEIADIEMQLKIVNTKIIVREAEVEERVTQLHESADQLRTIRAKVHKLIASDDSYKKILADSETYNIKFLDGTKSPPNPEQACELIKHLFKNLSQKSQYDHADKMKDGMYCEWSENDPGTTETSVYSSISDEDKRDCQVKIVKVTNVFKVAYLKNYIKQTRLRRAAKHAVLVKKVEAIKKMLEDWHKTLNMVTSNDPCMRDMEGDQMDQLPTQCLGGYSKPSLGQISDTDSELKDTFDIKEDTLNYIMNPQSPYKTKLDCNDDKQYELPNQKGDYDDLRNLTVLPEETCSQIEMQTRDN